MASEINHFPYINTLRATAWWLYIFHAVCFLLTLGIFSFIPLILNYLARPKAVATFVYTHHTWQIRSFWWYFIWSTLGWILYLTLVGIPIAFIIWVLAWAWYAYRIVRGFLSLNDNIPMPYPEN